MNSESSGPAGDSPYCDVSQLADRFRVSSQSIRRMVAAGHLPQPERFGKLLRWNCSVLDKFLADRRANSERRAAR
jgi:predicted DNA-binding transcriptional regulator AlpA